MNTTQVLEVLIPMLAMLVTFVGLALRFQTNMERSVDRSIDKFRTEVNANREKDLTAAQANREKDLTAAQANREKDREELQAFRAEVSTNREEDLTAAQANREEDRRELQDFRTEVLDRFETTNRKIDANTTAIAVNAAETNGNIALNTTKIDAIAAAAAQDRERSETFRAETRKNFKELGDKVDTHAATHDRNIRKVGDHVAGFKERVSRVEGYIEATSSRRPQPVTTSR